MKPDPKGLPSVTTWKVLGRGSCAATSAKGRHRLFSLSPSLRGEGRGEGSLRESIPCGEPPHPDLLPAGGEKEKKTVAPYAIALPASGGGEKKLTWLALTPVTGRTHQLRVHCAAMGWPIVGDNIYGTAQRFGGPTQQLHAREVVVPISKNKAPVRVIAPVPDHMRDWLKACGWNGEETETASGQ
jgi:tRNA pseudouridine32 synthase/23S rRNA pseudouridine746 synthase